MKYNLFLLLFSIGLFTPIVQAQTTSSTIIADLETSVQGEGLIRIQSDTKITALLGLPNIVLDVDETNYVKVNGFRIQVFMSNNSKNAKGEAIHKESIIRELFPDIPVHVAYQAPNWKVLVGDFVTRDETGVFLQKLQSAFPEFGREMYIVSDKVSIPIQKTN
jgi:hypothetical protein